MTQPRTVAVTPSERARLALHEAAALSGLRGKLHTFSNADRPLSGTHPRGVVPVTEAQRIAARVAELEDIAAGAPTVGCACAPGLRFTQPHTCG